LRGRESVEKEEIAVLLEDYGLIGDLESAALVGRNGSIDWLCLPRFDSASCFSALLGDEQHGRWLLAPAGEVRATARRYRPKTLVLETEFETADGAVRVIDFMPRRGSGPPRVMRIVEGVRGRVPMRMDLSLRPDYATIRPWVERASDGAIATAGPDAFRISTPLPLDIEDGTVSAEFVAVEGARERLTLMWHRSYEKAPEVEDADSALARTEAFWREWSGRCAYDGPYRDEVLTSLIALKAMTSETTGAVIAAPTMSLPEDIGGGRNWDYRYCWLRDSVLALEALLDAGYADEALAFRDFLLRVGTGDPRAIQIMYGIRGERRLTEFELPQLPGYEGSKPVRVGNAASEQFQLRRAAGQDRAAVLAALAGSDRTRRDDLAQSGRRDLGGARAATALHVLQGHGVGRVRSRGAACRAVRAGSAARALAAGPGRDPR
jgi:GH15 family glucan-1,4-alpha-glucosidase